MASLIKTNGTIEAVEPTEPPFQGDELASILQVEYITTIECEATAFLDHNLYCNGDPLGGEPLNVVASQIAGSVVFGDAILADSQEVDEESLSHLLLEVGEWDDGEVNHEED